MTRRGWEPIRTVILVGCRPTLHPTSPDAVHNQMFVTDIHAMTEAPNEKYQAAAESPIVASQARGKRRIKISAIGTWSHGERLMHSDRQEIGAVAGEPL